MAHLEKNGKDVISIDQVNFWLDAKIEKWQLLELLAGIANGHITNEQLKSSISNYMEKGE